MSFTSGLAAVLMSFILSEAPAIGRKPAELSKYVSDVNALVNLHDEISDGRLIDRNTDVLILSAVNYRESRLRNPSVDGDCHEQAIGIGAKPSAYWPKGFVPKYRMVCKAVGPMQINRGSAENLVLWPEVRKDFGVERGWPTTVEAERQLLHETNLLTETDLRDPKTNIRVAYDELAHWKTECRDKDGEAAPVGVWLAAYMYGHCPVRGRSGHFYVDSEAKKRCTLVNSLAEKLAAEGYKTHSVKCLY